jgi:hypothetical protein
LNVAELREKILETRLRWYGHMKRMEGNEFVKLAAEHREEERTTEEAADGLCA